MQSQNYIRQRNLHKTLKKRIFSFAVIADSHLNKDEAECNAPFPVNRLANGRLRHVVRELNQHDVDFVIHLGDLIHPVPAVKDLYLEAANRFNEQIADLKHPIHLVPGNHDVGDKPLGWSPAGEVNEAHLDLWTETFGKHYYAFDHNNCHFVMINAQIFNTGIASEKEQKEWLEQDLAKNTGKRIFINIHYPPFVCHPHEEEHYDNIGEPVRSWLLKLMDFYGVEGLFGGHVHNFWYLRHQSTDCYLLPSTAFVRQDYSEMLKAPPSSKFEAGRNDEPKLGYFIVHVYENGHACHLVRTYGRIAEPGSAILKVSRKVAPLSPRENFRAPLGFDLRESWAETVGIPPSGGLDEFDRKEVRNDYPLLALWEMGVRKLRVPLQDLRKPATCERMRDLTHHGHEFTLFSYGVPAEKDLLGIIKNRDILTSWEIGFAESDIDTLAPALEDAAGKTGIPLYLSKLWSHGNVQNSNEPYYHVINHGFVPSEVNLISELRRHPDLGEVLSGVVFRITHKDPVWNTIHSAASICRDNGLRASMHLRMAGSNPAEPTCDNHWTANRIAEALMAAMAHDNISIFVDTLIDIDRGYFVRNGVLDHLCNPHLGARVVRHLYGALNAGSNGFKTKENVACDAGSGFTLSGEQESHFLFLPDDTAVNAEIPLPEDCLKSNTGIGMTNLDSGEVINLSAKEAANMWSGAETKGQNKVPILFTWGKYTG